MMTVSQIISESIKRKGFATVKECAQALGLPYELLRKVIGEDHIPKDAQLLIYAKKLNIDPKELLFTAYHQKAPDEFKKYFKNRPVEESPSPYTKIPVLKWSEVRGFANKEYRSSELVSMPYMSTTLQGEHLFALKVKDDTMRPLFWEGDTIIVDPSAKPNSGDYAVVDMHDEKEPILRRVKQFGRAQMLCALNPLYDDIEMENNTRLVGRVIRRQADY